MAAPLYSLCLLQAMGQTVPITAEQPAGVIWVIRDIVVFARTGATGNYITIRGGSGGVIYEYYYTGTDAGLYDHWTGRQVIGEGQSFEVVPQAGSWDVAVSGYQLTAP